MLPAILYYSTLQVSCLAGVVKEQLSMSLYKLITFVLCTITELSTWEPLPIYSFQWTTLAKHSMYTNTCVHKHTVCLRTGYDNVNFLLKTMLAFLVERRFLFCTILALALAYTINIILVHVYYQFQKWESLSFRQILLVSCPPVRLKGGIWVMWRIPSTALTGWADPFWKIEVPIMLTQHTGVLQLEWLQLW